MRAKALLWFGAFSVLAVLLSVAAVNSETFGQAGEDLEAGEGSEPGLSPGSNRAVLDPLTDARIEVLKSKRQLILYSGDRIVKTYRIGLGFSPEGAKVRQGDGRTPEGSYYVCSKNPKSQYFLSLGLSYPNEADANRGLKTGLISRVQFEQITAAVRRGGVPLWNTALGGEIFIHGAGSKSDWTWGCVALENQDIQELFNTIPKGTPVTIKP
jgi:murein L,D-transpeptidase YafK